MSATAKATAKATSTIKPCFAVNMYRKRKDGPLERAAGYRKIAALEGEIYGIFSFMGYLLVHHGNMLSAISCKGGGFDFDSISEGQITRLWERMGASRSAAHSLSGALYILCKGCYVKVTKVKGGLAVQDAANSNYIPVSAKNGAYNMPLNLFTDRYTELWMRHDYNIYMQPSGGVYYDSKNMLYVFSLRTPAEEILSVTVGGQELEKDSASGYKTSEPDSSGKIWSVSLLCPDSLMRGREIRINCRSRDSIGRLELEGYRASAIFENRLFIALRESESACDSLYYSELDENGKPELSYFSKSSKVDVRAHSGRISALLSLGGYLAVFEDGSCQCSLGAVVKSADGFALKRCADGFSALSESAVFSGRTGAFFLFEKGLYSLPESLPQRIDSLKLCTKGIDALLKSAICNSSTEGANTAENDTSPSTDGANTAENDASPSISSEGSGGSDGYAGISISLWQDFTVLLAGGRIFLSSLEEDSEGRYEWYMLENVGSYTDDYELFYTLTAYPSEALKQSGCKLSALELALPERDVTLDPRGFYYAEIEGERYLADSRGQRAGGIISPATALLGEQNRLFFGCKNGDLCLFYGEKTEDGEQGEDGEDGENGEKIEQGAPLAGLPNDCRFGGAKKPVGIKNAYSADSNPLYYNRCGHAYPSYAEFESYSLHGIGQEKCQAPRSVTVKMKNISSAAFSVLERADGGVWREIGRISGGACTPFSPDFGAFSFEGAEYAFFTLENSCAPFREKQYAVFSNDWNRGLEIALIELQI